MAGIIPDLSNRESAKKEVEIQVVSAAGVVVKKKAFRQRVDGPKNRVALEEAVRRVVNQHLGGDVVNIETGELNEAAPAEDPQA